MPVSLFFRLLSLIGGKGVRKHVDWLWREIAAVIVTGSPGVTGTGNAGPYRWAVVTNQFGNDEQVTTIRMVGFSTNVTTRLARMIFVEWLRRQSAMKIVDKFVTDEQTTITAEIIDRVVIDSDTIEMSAQTRMATWSGVRMQLVRFPE